MANKVFLVDDDTFLLEALVRQFRKRFDLLTAESGKEVLEHPFADDPVAVIVSDMHMPGMDGLELLKKMKDVSPDTVRIMLTGNADQKTALDAINEGNIFRFFGKPCPHDILSEGIEEGIAEYNRVIAEREALSSTFTGAVSALVGLLTLAYPEGIKRSEKIRRWANFLVPHLKIKKSWRLLVAAMLSQLGNISIPPKIRNKMSEREKLSEPEKTIVNRALESARDLIANVPRLKTVSKMVYLQSKGADGSGPPFGLSQGATISRESKILKILTDLESRTTGALPTRETYELLSRYGGEYDAQLLGKIRMHLVSGRAPKEEVDVETQTTAPVQENPPSEEAEPPQAQEDPPFEEPEPPQAQEEQEPSQAQAAPPNPQIEKTQVVESIIEPDTPHPHPQFLPFQEHVVGNTPIKQRGNRVIKFFRKSNTAKLFRRSNTAKVIVILALGLIFPLGIYLGAPDIKVPGGDVHKHIRWIKNHLSNKVLRKDWKLISVKQAKAAQIDIAVLISDPFVVRRIENMASITRVAFLKYACPAADSEVKNIIDEGWTLWVSLNSSTKSLTGGSCHY